MTKDETNIESKGKQIIEALIGNGDVKVWIPVMATNLYMTSKDGEINKVEAVHVRDLEDESEQNK